MNIGTRIAIGAAATAAASYGGLQMHNALTNRTDQDLADIDSSLKKSAAEWDTWNSLVESEFPGRRLETPADHQRFAQFLSNHPAPEWVTVEHEDYTRIRVSTNRLPIPQEHIPVEFQKSNVYPMGFGAVLAVGGLASLGNGIVRGGSKLSHNLGMLVGGAAAAALGAASISTGVYGLSKGDGMGPVYDLQKRVNNS